jgi:hypothetical protein
MTRKKRPSSVYSLIDELTASPVNPMPQAMRTAQLTQMLTGLNALEKDAEPKIRDWQVVSDAINLVETLVVMRVCADESGLLADAVTAMAKAGQRHLAGGNIRLDAAGIQAVRAVIEDYASMLDVVPHRDMVHCHRQTEKRILEIFKGKHLPHDVKVIAL